VHILYGSTPGDGANPHREWKNMPTSDFVANLTEEPAIPEETPRLTKKEEHRA
jgi:hypothetical protein